MGTMNEQRTARSVQKLIAFFIFPQGSGDSMKGGWIMDGDLGIVEQGRKEKNGDIVNAEVVGEWTIRHLRNPGDQVALEAATPKYSIRSGRSFDRVGQ